MIAKWQSVGFAHGKSWFIYLKKDFKIINMESRNILIYTEKLYAIFYTTFEIWFKKLFQMCK